MTTERTTSGAVPVRAAAAHGAADGVVGRHPGVVPDAAELVAYAHLLPRDRRSAVVLGSVPQLRALAVAQFDSVVTVDPSATNGGTNDQDVLVRAAWTEVGAVVSEPVAAVLGDLVVGRLGSIEEVLALLHAVHGVLAPHGAFVTRVVVVPEGVRTKDVRHDRLLDAHRSGELDDAELGYATCVLGHLACCHDAATGRLDTAKIAEELTHPARYTPRELAAVERELPTAPTLVLPERRWLDLTADAGFATTRLRLSGRHWNLFAPLYALESRP